MTKLPYGRLTAYALAFVAFSFFVTRPIESYDLWIHIATGRWIARHRGVPSFDSFSMNSKRRWQAHSWLFDLASYYLSGCPQALPTNDGIRNIIAFKGAVCGVGFVILMDCAFKACADAVLSFLLTLVALGASLPMLDARPHVMTVFFLCLYLRLLIELLGGNGIRKAFAIIFSLFLSSVIWVNMHGGFIIGLIVALLFCVFSSTKCSFNRGNELFIPPHLLALIAVVVGSLINPYGLRALTYPISYFSTETRYALSIVTEWLPPRFNTTQGMLPLLLICACILLPLFSSAVDMWRREHVIMLAILSALTAVMALTSRRNICIFAVCSTLYLAMLLSQARMKMPHAKLGERGWHIVSAICLVIMVLLSKPLSETLRKPVREELFPYGAVQFISLNSLPQPLFNPYHWGGFLMAVYDGRIKVFIDGRADIYSADFLKRYNDAEAGKYGWDELLDEHGIMTALVDVSTPLFELMRLSTKWRLLYRDITGAVFVRRSNEVKDLLERADRDELVYPRTPFAMFYRGMICAQMGLLERAIEHWKVALSLKPDMVEAVINIGCACVKLKRWKEAENAFEHAIKLLGDKAPQYLFDNLRFVKEALRKEKATK